MSGKHNYSVDVRLSPYERALITESLLVKKKFIVHFGRPPGLRRVPLTKEQEYIIQAIDNLVFKLDDPIANPLRKKSRLRVVAEAAQAHVDECSNCSQLQDAVAAWEDDEP